MAEEEIKDTLVATEAPETEVKTKAKSKKGKRAVNAGQVHIQATFNNTIVTVTDKNGGALTASSACANGFRCSKKGTAYAAQIAAEKALDIAKRDYGLSSVDVFVNGIGLGRDSAIRAVSSVGIRIDSITDVTPIAHGGVRPKGERKP